MLPLFDHEKNKKFEKKLLFFIFFSVMLTIVPAFNCSKRNNSNLFEQNKTISEYSPEAFIEPVRKVSNVKIDQISKHKIGNDSIFKTTLDEELKYCLRKIKKNDYEYYSSYIEMGSENLLINEDTLPHPTDVVSCFKVEVDKENILFFIDFINSNINSSRPISGIVIVNLDNKTEKYTMLFKGIRVDSVANDFGEYKGALYFLNDDGGSQVNIYEYKEGKLKADDRKIILKDSIERRFIDWQKTIWP